jgi:predicted nucleic acid-binding protein
MAAMIIDAGPLVALLDRKDHHHPWAIETLRTIAPPMFTCEAAITEALFLLRPWRAARKALFGMWRDGLIRTPFRAELDVARVEALMQKYADVPMSYADACLVRLSESSAKATIITLDRDFTVYRRNGSKAIAVIAPWN